MFNLVSNIQRYRFLLVAILGTILFFSCDKNDENVLKPNIEEIEGLVINRFNKLPIDSIQLNLYSYQVINGMHEGPEYTKYSNQFGVFNFNIIPPEIDLFYRRAFSLNKGYENKFQKAVWVNGEVDTWRRGTTDVFFNNETPQQITYELYPITSFKLNVINTESPSKTDTIRLKLSNVQYFEPELQLELIGLEVNEIILRNTQIENILTIDYDVVKGGVKQKISKTFVCNPGELTEFTIEY